MAIYEYYCEVHGYMENAVRAKNKDEAKKKALDEMSMEGLVPSGEIVLKRVLKKDEDLYRGL